LIEPFEAAVGHTVSQLASLLRQRLGAARVVEAGGSDDAGRGGPTIAALANWDESDTSALTFLRSAGFARKWLAQAGGPHAALVGESAFAGLSPESLASLRDRALIVVADADLALIEVLKAMVPASPIRGAGLHPSSVVDPGASVDPSAHVGPGCVVEAGAAIGAGAMLIAQCFVGVGARVGDGSILHPGVRVLERCVVGRRCILHSGVVVGADGFGYRPRPDGRGLLKIPHIGNVVLGDDVEIGANTCVDRAKFGSTAIGSGTKIDNLVQIAHNCVIGRSCVLCGEVGLAGSVTLGDGVVLGAKVGIADNLTIGAGAQVGAAAGVMNDIPAGETWLGMPARPAKETLRMMAELRKLGQKR
jgi:UDP-3-O-[3-hydroxymyristoyl] glucosamine N-acyltransferase